MRLHRFYIPSTDFEPQSGLTSQQIEIGLDNQENDRLIHQWRDIFRFGARDKVLLFNETAGEWLAEFVTLDKKNGATLKIIEQNRAAGVAKPKRNIALYMAIIKNSNFDLVVEKATELGVSKIVPIKTERTVKSGLNFDRLNKLAIEASEQSGRIDIPEISEIVDLDNGIQSALSDFGVETIFFGHISENEEKNSNNLAVSENIALFIGPEGGWSDEEIKMFEEAGIKPISLGQFVLRAETAAIVGVSKLSI